LHGAFLPVLWSKCPFFASGTGKIKKKEKKEAKISQKT
jgi:hypothetical protein